MNSETIENLARVAVFSLLFFGFTLSVVGAVIMVLLEQLTKELRYIRKHQERL